MTVTIRKFSERDIPKKIEWINNPENNKYLHYELPLEYEKTCVWYEGIKYRNDRFDAVIEADGVPVGLIGLLSINEGKAEYYVSMGDPTYKGQGIATIASKEILNYAFQTLRLDSVYLYTEVKNVPAQRLFSSVGFNMKRVRYDDVISNGKRIDRYEYEITKAEWLRGNELSHIEYVESFYENSIFFKREDLISFSFGGNKARKAKLFFRDIDQGEYDCVVTYGTSHSNHCRVIANLAAQRNMDCIIIAPKEVNDVTFNSRMIDLFAARVITVPVEEVHETIENTIIELKKTGKHPYFIQGGGHGNIGTEAYVQCYDEIVSYEQLNKIHFDYIFFASGTGTTQAGLICGQLINHDVRSLVGISIARPNPRGRDTVIDSVKDFFGYKQIVFQETDINDATIFIDDYVTEGYGISNEELLASNMSHLIETGIPLDSTYTGKAFFWYEGLSL